SVNYVEGCTAPAYTNSSLHSAVMAIIAHKDAHVRYTTIQNWANNVYNLVTKRTSVYENGIIEWLDCNFGSKITMKYPNWVLLG
ncbi:SufD family Fe-S cluster assembly protein, partial [Staphylococcus aureus]|uniref:SufD family Fe-S cluster assembly protein n=1 Tax=Staphylococcus aureus TaxID=1280 RepID=UPI00065B777A